MTLRKPIKIQKFQWDILQLLDLQFRFALFCNFNEIIS